MNLFPDQQSHAVKKAMDILAILNACANSGQCCPSNTELAERTGYKSTASAADAISFLATCGLISVERTNHTRIVTICTTGKRTCSPRLKHKGVAKPRKPHHSAQINALEAVA